VAGLRKDVSRSEKTDAGPSLPAGRCKVDGAPALDAKEAIPWSKAVSQRQFWILAPVFVTTAGGSSCAVGDPCRNFHSGAFRLGCWDLGPCPNPYSSIVHPCVGAEAPGIKVKDASKEVAKSAWLKLMNLIIIDNHRMIPSDDSRRFQTISTCFGV
jgi:hypothetical protein